MGLSSLLRKQQRDVPWPRETKLVASLLGLRSLRTTAMRLLEVWTVGTKLRRTLLQSHHFVDGETEAPEVKEDAQGHT